MLYRVFGVLMTPREKNKFYDEHPSIPDEYDESKEHTPTVQKWLYDWHVVDIHDDQQLTDIVNTKYQKDNSLEACMKMNVPEGTYPKDEGDYFARTKNGNLLMVTFYDGIIRHQGRIYDATFATEQLICFEEVSKYFERIGYKGAF